MDRNIRWEWTGRQWRRSGYFRRRRSNCPSWAGGVGSNGGEGVYGGGGGGGCYIGRSLFGATPIAIPQTRDGFVTIAPDFVATPEPGSLLLLAAIGLGLVRAPKSTDTLTNREFLNQSAVFYFGRQ
jgi:hypothetical protein